LKELGSEYVEMKEYVEMLEMVDDARDSIETTTPTTSVYE
jgi:hypothetical protein